jgi:hypothetical protein
MSALFRLGAWVGAPALALTLNASPAQASVDGANFYITFNVNPTSISWVTCGSTQQDEGCYGSGTISPPFGKVCAILQGPQHVHGDTVDQKLYVLDADANNAGAVTLNVFKTEIVISDSYITTSFSPSKTVTLPLPGGSKVTCAAAANKSVLVAGTSTSDNAVSINKKTYALQTVGGFSPPETVSSIVANDQGYISVNQGSGSGTGFTLLGPDGSLVEDGGGNAVVFNSTNAYLP